MASVEELQIRIQALEAKKPDALGARQSRDVDTRARGIASLEILEEDHKDLLEELDAAHREQTSAVAHQTADAVAPTLSPLYASVLEDLADLAEAVSKLRTSSASYSNVVSELTLRLHGVATGSDRIRTSSYSTTVDGTQLRGYQSEIAGAVARIAEPLFRQLGTAADDLKFLGAGTGVLPPNPFATPADKTDKTDKTDKKVTA